MMQQVRDGIAATARILSYSVVVVAVFFIHDQK